jgi:uncharacterized membrane protein (UPF0127 family)
MATVLSPTRTSQASVRTAKGVASVWREDGTALCARCSVADRMWPRMKGLLGRRSLPAGEGVLIRPAPSVHTFFMRFAIDVVFLSRDGEVMKVAHAVQPWRIRSCRRAYAVLELSAGEAARRGFGIGERLVFREVAA